MGSPYPSTGVIFIFFPNFAGSRFLRKKRRWSRRRKTYFWIGDRFSFPVSGLEPAGVSHERLEIPPTSHGKGRKEGRKKGRKQGGRKKEEEEVEEEEEEEEEGRGGAAG